MTLFEPQTASPDAETDPDEGAILHVVCCFTDDLPITNQKTLCGATIDDDEAPDPTKDEDCARCTIIDQNSNFCPMFGECMNFEG